MPAGLLRRGGALFLDVLVFIGPALPIAFLPGVFVPLDRDFVLVSLLAVPIALAGIVYLSCGAALLPNTCGRWAMGVRVVDHHTGARPGTGQAVARMLTIGLWPIEVVLMAVSPSRRRLGDRWARTSVVRVRPAASWRRRLLPGLGAMAALGCLHPLTPLITARMDVSRAAVAFAGGEHGGTPAAVPLQAWVVNDSGTVTLRMDGGRHARVHLVRVQGQWTAERMEDIPRNAAGRGFSVRRSTISTRGT